MVTGGDRQTARPERQLGGQNGRWTPREGAWPIKEEAQESRTKRKQLIGGQRKQSVGSKQATLLRSKATSDHSTVAGDSCGCLDAAWTVPS